MLIPQLNPTWEVVWWVTQLFALSAPERFHRTLQSPWKQLWLFLFLRGPASMCSGCHSCFPFPWYGGEAEERPGSCAVSLRRQQHSLGSPGQEKKFPNPVMLRAVWFPALGCVSQLLPAVICFDIFFNWLIGAIVHFMKVFPSNKSTCCYFQFLRQNTSTGDCRARKSFCIWTLKEKS